MADYRFLYLARNIEIMMVMMDKMEIETINNGKTPKFLKG